MANPYSNPYAYLPQQPAVAGAQSSMANPYTLALGQGLSAAGGFMEGSANRQLQRELARQQQEQFLRQFALQTELGRRGAGLNEAEAAQGYMRHLEALPVRDQLLFALQQRAGMSPGEFRPADLFNPQASNYGQNAQQGGINLNQLQERMGTYRPGAGGTDPGFYEALLKQTGYNKSVAGGWENTRPNPAEPTLLEPTERVRMLRRLEEKARKGQGVGRFVDPERIKSMTSNYALTPSGRP